MASNGHLIVIAGKRAGEVLPFTDSMSIGRGKEVDVRFLDRSVSRRHLEIVAEGEGFRLSDLRSSCGTFVNGRRIDQVDLHEGDKIQIGETILEFHRGLPSPSRDSAAVRFVADQPFSEPQIERVVDTDRIKWIGRKGAKLTDARVVEALSLMYRVGNQIHAQTDLKAIYPLVMDSLFELLVADRGFLILREAPEERLRVVAARQGMQSAAEPLQSEITISRTIVEDCMTRAVSIVASDARFDERYKEGASVQLHNIRSVMCVPLRTDREVLGAIYLDNRATAGVFREFDLELASAIARQAGVAIERIRLLQTVEETFMGTVSSLVASIEAKDRYTRGHSERVASLAIQIAQELGLEGEDLRTLYLGAILHDVGKIGIDGHILKKAEKLTPEEYDIIKTHPTIGGAILAGVPNVERIRWIVEHHHERWDGTGFPDGIAAEEIDLPTRILSLADAYDAMTSSRPYRPAMKVEHALDELRRTSGRFFDPKVVEAFERIVQDGRLQPLRAIFPGKKLPNPSDLVRRGGAPREHTTERAEFLESVTHDPTLGEGDWTLGGEEEGDPFATRRPEP